MFLYISSFPLKHALHYLRVRVSLCSVGSDLLNDNFGSFILVVFSSTSVLYFFLFSTFLLLYYYFRIAFFPRLLLVFWFCICGISVLISLLHICLHI